jgi:protein-arginine kinase activator protein McsA
MITFEKKEEVAPICQHCKKELTTIWFQQIKGDLGKRCIYFCPQCKSCLGVSQRKGIAPFGL